MTSTPHLNLKLSKFDAIRFERRIGIGAPLNRVSQWIGLTRKQAIEKTISELEIHSIILKCHLGLEK